MAYAVFLMSSIASGALFALGARAMGVEHTGILAAIGIIGACLQMLVLILWYLHVTRPNQPVAPERIDPESGE